MQSLPSSIQLIRYVGGALGLACAGWALYLDISSEGADGTVMRWFGAALGIVVLSWALERTVKLREPRTPPIIQRDTTGPRTR